MSSDVKVLELPITTGGRLTITADIAALRIVGVDEGEQPRIELPGRLPLSAAVDVDCDGNGADVTISYESWKWWDRGTGSRVEVFVPRSIDLTVSVDAGRVDVQGLQRCSLEVTADAGDLRVSDCDGDLQLHTSAGRIIGEHVSGQFSVTTDAGTVRLLIDRLDAGKHSVMTSVGAIKVELAEGIDAAIDAQTSMGSARVDVPSRAGAPAKLEISSDVGTVRVKHATPIPPKRPPQDAGPYRSASAVATTSATSPSDVSDVPDDELGRVVRMVAEGKLSPEQAREILRALTGA